MGVWISRSSEPIDRYWGYRTVMRLLRQHLHVSRSHRNKDMDSDRMRHGCFGYNVFIAFVFPLSARAKTQQSSRCKFRSVSQGKIPQHNVCLSSSQALRVTLHPSNKGRVFWSVKNTFLLSQSRNICREASHLSCEFFHNTHKSMNILGKMWKKKQ